MTVMVSTIGTERTNRGTTGGTRLFSFWLIDMERKTRANPSERLPASPINNLEGGQLYLRKPSTTPAKAMLNKTSSVCLFMYASTANAINAIREMPPARPSSPSIILIALITPTVKNTVKITAKVLLSSIGPIAKTSPNDRTTLLLK